MEHIKTIIITARESLTKIIHNKRKSVVDEKIQFAFEEGLDFACKSKDENKIHIDTEYGKNSLYGEPIVHGCKALISIIEKKRDEIVSYFGTSTLNITYKFHNPIFYNEWHEIKTNKISKEQVKIIMKSGESRALKITVNIKKGEREKCVNTSNSDRQYADESTFAPKGESQISGLLMHSSYIVGMRNPGESSIYMEGSIECHSNDMFELQENLIEFETFFTKKSGMIRSNRTLTNLGVIHDFNALVRTEYRGDERENYEDFTSICEEILPLADAPQHIIIGGTSGLGKSLVRILESARQDYILISRQQSPNKKQIYMEEIDKLSLNSLRKTAQKEVWIYYFVSSRILPDKLLTYQQKNRLNKTLLEMPTNLLKTLIGDLKEEQEKGQQIKFIYPSTSFIDDNKMKEDYRFYANIKEIAEKTLREEIRDNMNMTIITPRLTPLNTRQNMSVAKKNAKDATMKGIISILKAAKNVHH